jgi:NDP-sugar pyrophosphorylase family protein
MLKQAIILCGGKGTRLLPLTASIPKAMLLVGGRPLIEDQIVHLKNGGVTNFILSTGHLSEAIESHFGNGSRLGVSIKYLREERPLGTAGAVFAAADLLLENFFVVYGDVFFRLDLVRLAKFHKEKKAAATLVVHESSHVHDSDIVEIDADLRITSFERRASKPGEIPLTNAAFLVLNKSILKFIPEGRSADFSRDVFPKAVHKAPCFGYETDEYIFDVGTIDRYNQLLSELSRRA